VRVSAGVKSTSGSRVSAFACCMDAQRPLGFAIAACKSCASLRTLRHAREVIAHNQTEAVVESGISVLHVICTGNGQGNKSNRIDSPISPDHETSWARHRLAKTGSSESVQAQVGGVVHVVASGRVNQEVKRRIDDWYKLLARIRSHSSRKRS
jgi:hypothetical protein